MTTMAGQKESMSSPLPGPRYVNPLSLVRSLIHPTEFMLRARERYGDTFRLPTVLGPAVITGDPEGVRAIFSADPDTVVPFQPDLTSPLLGEASLVLVSGAHHRRDRKLLSPPFQGARMRAYGAIMAESTRRAVAAWTSGVPFKMLDTTQGISLDVILQAVMGLDHATPHGQAVRQAIVRFMGSARPHSPPKTWAEASTRHQELFGGRPRRLQSETD